MKLKIRTINQVVVIVSIISAILDVVVAIMHGTPWWAWPLTGVCTFLITYYLSKFFLRKYIIYRIKPLYQLILSKDIITSKLSDELRKKVNSDIVDDIQENLNHLVTFSGTELERLEEQQRLRSELLVAIFHEIKTPAAIIKGYTQTLLEGGVKDPETFRNYLNRTIVAVERLSGTIKDMETITCYDSGMEQISKEKIDIFALTNEVVTENQFPADDKNIRIQIDKGPFPLKVPVMVYADPFRIKQVLENLITNAIKYNEENGSIIVSYVDMFDKILIEVSDSGIGIPAEDIPRLFEDFYRVNKSRSRKQGGSGLGLAIVKRIIDAHKENITVRSEVGVGTTFSFTLAKEPLS